MRTRLTITLKDSILEKIDSVIDGIKIRNRSHAIEYFLNKVFYTSETQAVILAGGKGTRLRPYTYEVPKSMLLLKNKPLLEYLIIHLRNSGIKDIIICINEQGSKIKEYFGDGSRFNVRIVYSQEKTELGTGGALYNAKDIISSSPFLLLHGDLLTDIDIKEMLSYHQQAGTTATMALKPIQNVKRFGQINLKGSVVTAFYGNKKAASIKRSNLINAGIYVLNQDIFKHFPSRAKFALEEILTTLIHKQQVAGYVFDSLWVDVGDPQDYEQALKILQKKFTAPRKS